MKTKQNNIELVIGQATEMKGDVVLNWATPNLRQGPQSFIDLHKAAGPQLFDATVNFMGHVKESDCFSTIAGFLKFNLVVHCVMPTHVDYAMAWRNIIATLKRYKRNNVCRDLYITIPDETRVRDFITQFFNYQEILQDFTFVFIAENESQLKLLKRVIKAVGTPYIQKEPFFTKIESIFKKLVSKISPQSSSILFFKKLSKSGLKQEELQEGS